MTQDDLSNAIKAKRAELEALETEAKTLPFTTDDKNKIDFTYDAIMYLYSELRGERHPEQVANDHRVRFKLIETLDKRLAAVEATTRMIGEEVFPDNLPVCIYSHRLDEYRTPIVMEYEGDDCVTIEPRHVRSDLKRILTPKARDHLQDLRAQADAFAQLPAVKMTREEVMAFLDAAPVRGDD